jgi:hypothetical protein
MATPASDVFRKSEIHTLTSSPYLTLNAFSHGPFQEDHYHRLLPLILFVFEYLGFLVGITTIFMISPFASGGRKTTVQDINAAIDEKTLAALGPWPLKRTYYASILEKMKEADVVAFDVFMAEALPMILSMPKQ